MLDNNDDYYRIEKGSANEFKNQAKSSEKQNQIQLPNNGIDAKICYAFLASCTTL